MSRWRSIPLPVAAAGALFILCGVLVALLQFRTLLETRGEGDTLTPLLLAIGVGVALVAVGIGILAGQRWARILGAFGALLAVLAGVGGLAFSALMAISVGIGLRNRLFVEPAVLAVIVIVLGSACLVVLARHGAWFRSRAQPIRDRLSEMP